MKCLVLEVNWQGVKYENQEMKVGVMQELVEISRAVRDNHLKKVELKLDNERVKELDIQVLKDIVRISKQKGEIRLTMEEEIEDSKVDEIIIVLKSEGCQNTERSKQSVVFMKIERESQPMVIKRVKKQKNDEQKQKQPDQNGVIINSQQYNQKVEMVIREKKKKVNPFDNVEGELIDENQLLQNDEVQKVESQDCSTKPRACKNCSCGRKEMEEQMDKEQLLQNIKDGNIKSSCGSCYLGDAFRCASCPYKGLPAFKPGDTIKLKETDDQIVEEEQTNVNIKGGKVKLM